MIPLLVGAAVLAFLLLSKQGTLGSSDDPVVHAAETALATETDPQQLMTFGDSLMPDYQAWGNKLQAKAKKLAPR